METEAAVEEKHAIVALVIVEFAHLLQGLIVEIMFVIMEKVVEVVLKIVALVQHPLQVVHPAVRSNADKMMAVMEVVQTVTQEALG